MNEQILLTEKEIVEKLHKYVDKCDGDELVALASMAFGGSCYLSPKDFVIGNAILYIFEPNENYWGAFGKLE